MARSKKAQTETVPAAKGTGGECPKCHYAGEKFTSKGVVQQFPAGFVMEFETEERSPDRKQTIKTAHYHCPKCGFWEHKETRSNLIAAEGTG